MKQRGKYNRVVLTQSFEEFNPHDKELREFLAANYKNKFTTKYYRGITIVVYSR